MNNEIKFILLFICSNCIQQASDLLCQKKSGLKLPSVIRVHKLATLEKDMVEIIMGQIDNSTKEKVRTIITKMTD